MLTPTVFNDYGRIVNVSSGMGQLSEMNEQYAGYRLSKVTLNALTKIFACGLNCNLASYFAR